ncbi:MAG: hypothetical protein L6Q77_06300 [Bacteroidetes bacterium]|nr:hypothetical protein [Bacteroidota bacterium]
MKFVKLIPSCLFMLFFLTTSPLLAQNTGLVTVSTDIQPVEGKNFSILVTPSNPAQTFSKVVIGYRLPNDEFTETEMRFEKGAWKYLISGEFAVPPRLEYYLVASLDDGSEATYPVSNYRQNPAYLTISPKGLTDAIVVMMGENGSKSAPEDFMIMLSYYSLSDQIDLTSVRLTINGADVTKDASVTADALNYFPATPPKGKQSVSFEAKLKDGTLVGPLTWSVSVVSKEEAKEEEEAEQNYSLAGNVWNEYRYEKTSARTKGTDRANASASGNIHWLTYNINLFKSSEESKKKQAIDRYTLKLGTEYLDLTFGDAYPSFSRLMMNGTRVRGFEANLKSDYINLDVGYGFQQRAIDAEFEGETITLRTIADKDSIETLKGELYQVLSKNAVNTTLRKKTSSGAYDRKLLAVKTSFGSKKQGFNWGLGFLRSLDDTTSNKYGGEAIANLVVSTDAQLRYDNGRFELYGDAALSLENNDIKYTSQQFDSVMRDQLGSAYKTINQIFPLSAGISAPTGTSQILNYSAFLAGMKLNYWNNYFKVEYLRNGTSYHSEGLPFFQKDIQGVKLNDRLRLFQNKLFLTFGYDLLYDNTDGTKDFSEVQYDPVSQDSIGLKKFDGTTARNNIRTGISFFPGGGLPSLSFDYIRLASVNEIPENQVASQNNASNTFQISTNYGFSWMNGYHTTSLSYSLTDKKDLRDEKVYLFQNGYASAQQKVQSVVLAYGTTIGQDLSFNLSYNNSSSEYREVLTNDSTGTKGITGYGYFTTKEQSYNILEGSLGKSFLDNKLQANVRANMTLSDVNQYIFGANAQYYFLKNLFATSDANFILNEGSDADLLFTFRVQYIF